MWEASATASAMHEHETYAYLTTQSKSTLAVWPRVQVCAIEGGRRQLGISVCLLRLIMPPLRRDFLKGGDFARTEPALLFLFSAASQPGRQIIRSPVRLRLSLIVRWRFLELGRGSCCCMRNFVEKMTVFSSPTKKSGSLLSSPATCYFGSLHVVKNVVGEEISNLHTLHLYSSSASELGVKINSFLPPFLVLWDRSPDFAEI